MPGVSGEAKERGPPISLARAKLPGVVPWRELEGLPPSAGSRHARRAGGPAGVERGFVMGGAPATRTLPPRSRSASSRAQRAVLASARRCPPGSPCSRSSRRPRARTGPRRCTRPPASCSRRSSARASTSRWFASTRSPGRCGWRACSRSSGACSTGGCCAPGARMRRSASPSAVPLLLLAQLEWQLPVFGWIGAESQDHVLARRPARARRAAPDPRRALRHEDRRARPRRARAGRPSRAAGDSADARGSARRALGGAPPAAPARDRAARFARGVVRGRLRHRQLRGALGGSLRARAQPGRARRRRRVRRARARGRGARQPACARAHGRRGAAALGRGGRRAGLVGLCRAALRRPARAPDLRRQPRRHRRLERAGRARERAFHAALVRAGRAPRRAARREPSGELWRAARA